jgi:GntR family transcriptional regulator/MocR family aminotransferase
VDVFVDPNDPRPLTTQLYEQLRDAIVEGRLGPGDRLAPTRTLAADLGVSRSTVTEVYGRLVAEGYIEGRSGRGSTVAAITPPSIRPRPTAAVLMPTARAAAVALYGSRPAAEAMFDLRPGSVDPSLFPSSNWRRCMLKALAHVAPQYGDPAGTTELRSALARWVTRSRGVAATADEVVVTSGSGHAIDLLARVLLNPGDVVAVEEPGYPPVTEQLRSHGLTVMGVPVDHHGIVVDAIPRRARMIYVTPSHQYPLGVVMARHRRHELLQWASRNNAAVIEDDYDSEFRHSTRPLEPLQRLDRDGRVIYVGTFSKTLSPALRLGFLVAPRSLIPAICAIRQAIDWCPPTVTQTALCTFIEQGHLDRHLRRSRLMYRERHRLLWEALELLPAGYRRLPAPAGLHLAIIGADVPGDDRLLAVTAAHKLLVGSLRYCYQVTDPVPGLLVGFGALPTSHVLAACQTLRSALLQAQHPRVDEVKTEHPAPVEN